MARSTAERDRNFPAGADGLPAIAVDANQLVAVLNECQTALCRVLPDDGIIGGQTEKQQLARIVPGFFHEQLIISVEDQRTARLNRVTHDPFDVEQLLQVLRTEVAQVVLGDVGDQRNICLADAETAAQQTASRGLQDRNVDFLLAQHVPRTAGT